MSNKVKFDDDDMLRPIVAEVELDVHKIADRVWNKGESPEDIVSDYYMHCGIIEVTEYGSAEQMIADIGDTHPEYLPPELTVNDVKSILDYAECNRDLIEPIIDEDRVLKDVIFGDSGVRNEEEIKRRIKSTELSYFNIEFEQNQDGYNISWQSNQK